MATTRSDSATLVRTTRGLDQVVDIETPEQVVFSYTIAGIGSRAAAALIDYGIITGSILFLSLLYSFVIAPVLNLEGAGSLFMQRTGGWLVAVLMLLIFVVQWGYYVLFEALWDGQTPGKRRLRLRVVQDGGYSVSFAASSARNIARVLDMQPAPTYLIGLTTLAVSRTAKRGGDHLAGTIVVRERILGAVQQPPTDAPAPTSVPLQAALTDTELELLERFVARMGTLDSDRLRSLTDQMVRRFAAHLPEAESSSAALRGLLQREQGARAQGVSARGQTGAAREQYALMAAGQERWARFAASLSQAQRTGLARMSAQEVSEFVAQYREVATDLARLSTAGRGREPEALFRLSRLVAGGHNLFYRQERMAFRHATRFIFRSVPAELRRSFVPILAAAVLFFGSGLATYFGVLRNPALVDELVSPVMIDRAETSAAAARNGDLSYIEVEDYARPVLASGVLSNNVQVAFLAFASGLSAGILTVLLLLFNGVSIGAAFGLFSIHGVGHVILDFVIAHSAFELTAISVAAAAGFLIAEAILLPGARTRGEALVLQSRRALRLLTAAGLMLVLAGGLEGLISPRTDLPFALKASLASLSVLLTLLYASLGRGASPDETREVMAYRPTAATERRVP